MGEIEKDDFKWILYSKIPIKNRFMIIKLISFNKK